MNLISCEHCGTVIDIGRIAKGEAYDEDGAATVTARWNSSERDFMPTIECPACKGRIFYQTGDKA